MSDKELFDKIIDVPLLIHHKNGNPAIEFRKCTTDLDIIKQIISAAYHDQPIIIYPKFSNKFKSIGRLIEVGLVYKNKETNQYEYNI